MDNRKTASIGVFLPVTTVARDCSSSVITVKILIKYKGSGSSRYDEKEYLESASRIRREKNVKGPLKISGYIGGGGRREMVPCILYFCMVVHASV